MSKLKAIHVCVIPMACAVFLLTCLTKINVNKQLTFNDVVPQE